MDREPLSYSNTDSSIRKEQKVRAGFVPQEDMSAFRGRRQLEAEARRGVVPGSSGRVGLGGIKADNPFAQQQDKSKAAVKNDKRRVSRTAALSHNWDSASEDEDDEEAARRAFASLRVDTKDEKAFPPLGGGRRPSNGRKSGSTSPLKNGSPSPTKSAWKTLPEVAPPPQPSTSTPSSQPPQSSSPAPNTSSTSDSASTPSWRTRAPRGRGTPPAAQWNASRPHPIQGGRKGPIGLAHPPPIEPSPQRGRGRGRGGYGGRGRGRGDYGNSSDRPAQDRPPKPERTREPVRVRETGPLADRVRNLLLQNQAADRPRRTPGAARTATDSATSGGSGAEAKSAASVASATTTDAKSTTSATSGASASA